MTNDQTQSDATLQSQAGMIPPPPTICRIAVGVLGLLVALSALPWAWFALGRFGGFDWGLFGFEIFTILAGIYAVLLGMGRFREGWAIGVTAIAGSILVALVFGIYVDFIMAKQSDFPDLYPLAKYTLMGRAAIIALLFAFASLAVFARNSRSIGFLIRAAMCAAPIAIVALLMQLGIGPGAWINSTLQTTTGTGAVQVVLAMVLGLFFIVLISVTGHLLIRAYECGRPAGQRPE